ncbi:unnamed protein product [Durusdinium trenchii]|uniref:Transmembrane protein n=1 Tax=Durusdinium trenchii TaxID=1381693 RepID=A0ABP0L668_9DINO
MARNVGGLVTVTVLSALGLVLLYRSKRKKAENGAEKETEQDSKSNWTGATHNGTKHNGTKHNSVSSGLRCSARTEEGEDVNIDRGQRDSSSPLAQSGWMARPADATCEELRFAQPMERVARVAQWFPLPSVEIGLMAFLFTLLVRAGALVGQTSEEQAKSGILPAEQIVWNFQKLLRCMLVVLCFTSAFLQKHKLFEWVEGSSSSSSSSWPKMIFHRLSEELWLLPSNEAEGVAQRRRLTLLFVMLGRALLGTIRSFIKFRAQMSDESSDASRLDETESRESSRFLCSGFFINWIIFLLDVTANCGFLLGFSAGRHYFRCTQRAPSHGPEAPALAPLVRPQAVSPEAEDGETTQRHNDASDDDQPKSSFASERSLSREVDHGPMFRCYASRCLLGFLVASALECWLLSYWEAGILGSRDDEVDVFRLYPGFPRKQSPSAVPRPYFQSWTPDFSRWRLRRLILGSWRDLFYFVLLYVPLYPFSFGAFIGSLFLLARWKRGNKDPEVARNWVMTSGFFNVLEWFCSGLFSYLSLLTAQRAYFYLSCLLICWECRRLEERANDFARQFPQLSPRQRYLQHFCLANEVKQLQQRSAPLIRYVFLQRLAYLALDVARQSCDAWLPFNLVHYLFRHVMFLSALAITAWRIGKLNFSIYEKLHNTVMDLLPRNWAEHWGHSTKLQLEVVMQRQHAEDWFRYLQHNIDTGRRDACICVFHLRFAAKSHVLALSVLTLLTLPVLNKLLEHYGRHVVNDGLLLGSDGVPPGRELLNCSAFNESFLRPETCAA